jgi:hypothetical protein
MSSFFGQQQIDSLESKAKHGIQIDALVSNFTSGFNHYSLKYTFEKKKIKLFAGPTFGQKLGEDLRSGWHKVPNTFELKGFNFGVLYQLSKYDKTFQWTVQYDFNFNSFNMVWTGNFDDGYNVINHPNLNIRNTVAPGFRINIKEKFYLNSSVGVGIAYYKWHREFQNGFINNFEGGALELSFNISVEYKI